MDGKTGAKSPVTHILVPGLRHPARVIGAGEQLPAPPGTAPAGGCAAEIAGQEGQTADQQLRQQNVNR